MISYSESNQLRFPNSNINARKVLIFKNQTIKTIGLYM